LLVDSKWLRTSPSEACRKARQRWRMLAIVELRWHRLTQARIAGRVWVSKSARARRLVAAEDLEPLVPVVRYEA
jgi:hypothetical protein